jgi:prevent-host-death family protein
VATRILPISEARASLPHVVKAANEKFERTVITTNGKPVAVVMSYEEYQAWEESLEILSDAETMKDWREARAAIARGETFSFEDVFGKP